MNTARTSRFAQARLNPLIKLVALAGLVLAPRVLAVPTTVTSVDTPGCDVLSVPPMVDELGRQIFPPNEHIDSGTPGPISVFACPSSAPAGSVATLVRMVNFTGIPWDNVW